MDDETKREFRAGRPPARSALPPLMTNSGEVGDIVTVVYAGPAVTVSGPIFTEPGQIIYAGSELQPEFLFDDFVHARHCVISKGQWGLPYYGYRLSDVWAGGVANVHQHVLQFWSADGSHKFTMPVAGEGGTSAISVTH